ncbi:MAG: sulfatase-like hydrolase/transferase [Fuerstiella sp.]|nr:sulfatase-like hydrolase/transferase [Fuerstiella sp.]
MRIAFFTTLVLVFGLNSLLPALEQQPPNIVFILADDLGYGDIGCYGSAVNRTPHLDRLAAGGMRFTDFHSNGPMCSPTRAAFLTGLYQSRFGRRFESALSGSRRDPGLPLSAVTIAEVLQQAGYFTGMFGKWHLGYEAPWLPTNQGFAEFRGLVSGDGDHHTQIDRSGNQDWWNGESVAMQKGYTAELITQHSIDFIERHKDERFFLYVPHLAIHFPWQGPNDPPHRKRGISYHKDKWGVIPDRSNVLPHVTAMIESLDRSVGSIVATLDRLGLSKNTLVVFTSDNGGYLDYAGGFENISDMGQLRGEKGTIYEGGHRVPAIFSWPETIKPSVCHQTAMTFDLFPTLAALAGTNANAAMLDGSDLSETLFDGANLPERSLFWRMGSSKAVRKGSWKLCVQAKRPPELYNLATDVGERKNLADRRPEVLSNLKTALAEWELDVEH